MSRLAVLFFLFFYTNKQIHKVSDLIITIYFFPVFLADFLWVFLAAFLASSFFCWALTIATFLTIFCSSMRKARRMLHHEYKNVQKCFAMLCNALQCWCDDRKKNLPVVDALVAHVTTVSTSDGTARSNSVSVSTDVEVRNLRISE